MRKIMIGLLVLLWVCGAAMAQWNAQSPYEIALERIEEAERTGPL